MAFCFLTNDMFERKVLEVLREPLESGYIAISRAARQATFPARFQLIAAMNPCPCGYYGHFNQRCRCTPDQIKRYKHKVSGPLIDRIDLNIDVPALKPEELHQYQPGESTSQIQHRVEHSRTVQIQRQNKPNTDLTPLEIKKICPLNNTGNHLLQAAVTKLSLSARAYHRILKVARTIADLEKSATISDGHVAEAIQYRRTEL